MNFFEFFICTGLRIVGFAIRVTWCFAVFAAMVWINALMSLVPRE